MPQFDVTPGGFLLDGSPHRVLSGALHYFRVLPEQWPHRLRMLRAMGLNCVETYVPWNLHEPEPGVHHDLPALGEFLTRAAEAGLHAIVRPGPYICAEWENGGLPAWLTGRDDVRLRCLDEPYLEAVDRWFDVLVPLIAEHQITRGGNVLMVQVENEYGSYGSDQAYLRDLADGLVRRGIDVPLFTSDGPEAHMLTGGTLPGVLATVNFGSDPEGAFAALAEHRPQDPPFCMEYWNGWFDHWGERHTTRDATDAADVLDRMLAAGASVNVYMAHGGTNFGTWAGANRGGPDHAGAHAPTVTSYDYDAPVDERGAATEKFRRFREVLAGYATEPLPDVPEPAPLLTPGEVRLTESLRLFDVLDVLSPDPVVVSTPPTFEQLGLTHGLVLYRTALPGPRPPLPLTLDGLADRAHLFLDGKLAAVLDGDRPALEVAVPGERRSVDVLVESMGRVNYGPLVGGRKGIVKGVRHALQWVHGYEAHPIDVAAAVGPLPWGRAEGPDTSLPEGGPVFHRGWFEVDAPADGWIAPTGWGKGYIWVNGFCLGRYWSRGPQGSLYLPWPLLRPGRNEIVVLELDGANPATLAIRDEPDLGDPAPTPGRQS
ncbi:beta-galactosidase family protein [Streptomyces sp. NPDC059874]|uniref:glycoside hydrolase family 35 protein n=1 Tax=Streptomyces sp. NPDC059874 TaxID=3346983 RepID=UPI003655DC7C